MAWPIANIPILPTSRASANGDQHPCRCAQRQVHPQFFCGHEKRVNGGTGLFGERKTKERNEEHCVWKISSPQASRERLVQHQSYGH